MRTLYQELRDRLSPGIQYEDAVQLFLTIFCIAGVLPQEMALHAPNKEPLIDAFERLEADGLILPPLRTWKTFWRKGRRPIEWSQLVSEFLLNRVELDLDFKDRAVEYLRLKEGSRNHPNQP